MSMSVLVSHEILLCEEMNTGLMDAALHEMRHDHSQNHLNDGQGLDLRVCRAQ